MVLYQTKKVMQNKEKNEQNLTAADWRKRLLTTELIKD
jgi:hypothetical protein